MKRRVKNTNRINKNKQTRKLFEQHIVSKIPTERKPVGNKSYNGHLKFHEQLMYNDCVNLLLTTTFSLNTHKYTAKLKVIILTPERKHTEDHTCLKTYKDDHQNKNKKNFKGRQAWQNNY